MAKVKGYYNTCNGVFLGPMTAVNEATGVASTPRYVEGVCFGEYNTQTGEFVPETNPMTLPTGVIHTQDDQFDANGNIITHVSGMIEDKGLDIARKQIHSIALHRTPGVVSKSEDGKILGDRYVPSNQTKLIGLTPSKQKSEKPKVKRPDFKVPDVFLEEINFDKLFG